MESYVGKKLGNRYEVGDIIGQGGCAVVYKAYDPLEDRIVAIKILKEEFLADEDFCKRFMNEAKAIAMLSHPNIVKVYDIFSSKNLQYIVMEYIKGITLKEYIRQEKIIDWKEAVHYTTQILRALQHAHDRGIVHRDIKPQNIMLLQDGTIKVADFGIAHFQRGETRTQTNNGVLGSVHYISPEQASGERTDAQTDIYSVGVVLYEMITGRVPFDSDVEVSIMMMQVQSEPVLPREINPTIPIGLEQIALHAMQKSKINRYHTASEMLLDLDEFKRNPSMRFDYGFTTITPNQNYSPDNTYITERHRSSYEEDYQRRRSNDSQNYSRSEEESEDYEEEDEEEEEEDNKSRSVLLPVLIGVFSVLVVSVILVGIFVLKPRLGNDSMKMPQLVGQKYEDVIKKYTDLKFADPVYVYNKDYAEGLVCEQSVKEGEKITKDTEIRLSVASGEGVPVVDVVGYSYSDATSILRSYNLDVSVIPEKSSTVKEGLVIRTDPAANDVVQTGSTIKLYVATADENAPVKVPNVIGLSEDAAKQAILDAGLVPTGETAYGKKEDAGKVIRQDPEKDTEVKKGAQVKYTVSLGEEEKKTLQVRVKMPLSDSISAEASIYMNGNLVQETNVQLDGKERSFEFTGIGDNNEFEVRIDSFSLAKGKINFSATPPSYEVTEDNSANFVVKKTIPDVNGLSLENARSLLDNEGFTNITVLEQETDDYTPGTVISQSPSDITATYELDRAITLVVARKSSAVVTTVEDTVDQSEDE